MVIITLEDYKSYAGINNPKTDEKLQFIVDFVNKYIKNYCNSDFDVTSVTGVRVTSNDGYELLLPNAPLISVEEVRVGTTVVDEETYTLDKEEGSVITYDGITTVRLGTEVDYTYGYAAVPADLALAALEFVTHLHKREFTKSRNLGNGESADYGDPELLPPQVRIGLNMYRVS